VHSGPNGVDRKIPALAGDEESSLFLDAPLRLRIKMRGVQS
jgi:hypothetical protein